MSRQKSTNPKTMIQIIDDSTMGGAEIHTKLLTKEFALRGYKILLLCPPGPFTERFEELKKSTGLNVEILVTKMISKQYMNPLFGFDIVRLIKAIKLIRSLINMHQIQVIHSHKHPVDFLVALATVGIPSLKKVTTIHSMDNKDKFWVWRWWRYFFVKKSLTKFDFIFTVSEYVRINTIRYFSLPPQKVITMMNGIDLSELCPDLTVTQALEKYGVKPNQLVLLSTGKLEYRKGQDILLRAVASVIESGELTNNIVVLLAGNSNHKFERNLRNLSYQLGIEEKIIWIGYESNIANLLQLAHIYIQPSRWDPLPRALIEAMGKGVFSIGSNVDGIPELIEHDKTGLLFENENVSDLALQLRKALLSPQFRRTCSEEAIKKVKRRHTIRSMVDTIELNLAGGKHENRS